MAELTPASSSSAKMSDYEVAYRGLEITGLDVYQRYAEDITAGRAQELMSEMNADVPLGGSSMEYGSNDTEHLQFGQDVRKLRLWSIYMAGAGK